MDLRNQRSSHDRVQKLNSRRSLVSGANALLLTLAAATTVIFASTGCVSVSLKTPGKATKAVGVKYRAPSTPFTPLASTVADQAWQNKANGNSVAYHSSCNDPADPSAESAQAEVLSSFEDVRVIRNEDIQIDGRTGLDTEAEGLLDGVRMHIDVAIFKKNYCIYTLTYVGTAARFKDDQKKFRDFIASFGAP